MTDILSQYNFPPEAVADLGARGLTAKNVARDITAFEQGGHDKGIAYRFFTHAEVNKLKSEDFDIDVFDEIEMIQWFVRKDHKPVERVEFLPDGLLKFVRDKKTNKVIEPRVVKGGEYAEAYKRWKEGLTVNTGLPLARWGELSLGELSSLESTGIFTVQQFASLSEDIVKSRYPKNLQEKFEKAVRFVAGQNTVDVSKYTDQVATMKQEMAKMRQEMEALRAEAPAEPIKPKRVRRTKAQMEESGSDGD